MLRIIWLEMLSGIAIAAASNSTFLEDRWQHWQSLRLDQPDECFNCQLPKFACGQFAECRAFDGLCSCPDGFMGIDCLTPRKYSYARPPASLTSAPECGSLAVEKEKRPPRPSGQTCSCDEGWAGPNCNVCTSDASCANFRNNGNEDMACFRNGPLVAGNQFMCDVTNKGIIKQLGSRKPEVTYSCDKVSAECKFQFWVGAVESFYCALDSCANTFTPGDSVNTTLYECEKLRCSCIPGRMLCGENGQLDLTDFFAEELKGPAKFTCAGTDDCKFEEDAMNGLIHMVFSDDYIQLKCQGGECLAREQLPGFKPPPRRYRLSSMWLSLGALGSVMVAGLVGAWYFSRHSDEGRIKLPPDEHARMMAEHIPASLHFSGLSYTLPGSSHKVLDSVSGCVHAGEVLAIIGASGAGKSTLLDILARRQKQGKVSGSVLINGRDVEDGVFRRLSGYVDQEDTLMGTLTVYETVFYSALLRLPRGMSLEAKQTRTMETLRELGIMHIRDKRVGESGRRSISGGEKRRVSIACELVTSPSIIFLDEPTSGLDAYNAYNVVDCLVKLAHNYKRTVIFTIHQPRSNIVMMFDRLIVLGKGKLVYSGAMDDCQDYLAQAGFACPRGFNIADFLIDTTMDAPPSYGDDDEIAAEAGEGPDSPTAAPSAVDEELGLVGPVHAAGKLQELVDAYASSSILSALANEISEAQQQNGASASVADGVRHRASWPTQFRILSGRAFINLYRDPALLLTHYLSSIAIALFCGYFYYHTPNIEGFQNRLGLFFFALALFAFSCLSSLGLIAKERVLFIRERANGYYSTFTYFSSKVLFDIIPLRVVPPLLFGGIVYGLVGLVPETSVFLKFLLILVLFNLTAASVVLVLSITFTNTGVASLVGTLVILFNLLFGGLLINWALVPHWLRWLFTLSFFHAAYEALAVNELRYLTLKDQGRGPISIPDIPAAVVLTKFGLRANAFWWDASILAVMFAAFTLLAFLYLHYFVKEHDLEFSKPRGLADAYAHHVLGDPSDQHSRSTIAGSSEAEGVDSVNFGAEARVSLIVRP
ncbi:hypothetical protein AURDEDRAFT_159530 [Auricularia subglabra TFB-10046 SS5]|nr:hypothetical protein AURDEDRAFT_159530 [Auricularia subglabra TFB-10046 SS5]